MQFNQIIGQQKVKQRLIQSAKDGRISHAQLFLAKEGAGGLPLAIAYCQFLACTDKQENDSCGLCPSCIKFNKLVHPDLHFVFPVNTTSKVKDKPTSNAFLTEWREAVINTPYMNLFQWLDFIGIDNKQGNISAHESDEILKKLSLKPYESEYKFMIIWMAEKMNGSAANKILKILEEPPDKTLFILVAEQQEQLMQTILSRTQLVKINGIEDAELKQHLMFEYQLSIEQALEVVNLSEGNFNEAVRLSQETDSENYYMNLFRTWMQICYNKDFIKLTNWIDEADSLNREKQKQFLTYSLHLIRESLITAYNADDVAKSMGAEKDFVFKFHKFLIKDNAVEVFEAFNEAIFHVERNAFAKLLFMDLSLKLFKWVRA